MLVIGGFLLVEAMVSLAVCSIFYFFRWAYVRRVYYAQQKGEDAYQAARICAEVMASDFISVVVISTAFVVILGVALIALGLMRLDTASASGS